jgi:hypothetical protein
MILEERYAPTDLRSSIAIYKQYYYICVFYLKKYISPYSFPNLTLTEKHEYNEASNTLFDFIIIFT